MPTDEMKAVETMVMSVYWKKKKDV